MRRKPRYKNMFIYSSLQFCGNIEEYFADNSEKLVAYLMLPRLKNQHNIIRYYVKGKLKKEISVPSSENIFLYYTIWYVNYLRCLFFFKKSDKIIVLSGHPISFFFMGIQKFFRNITYVFWVCDYFPPNNFPLKVYEGIKRYYHTRVSISYYLSDGINRVFNGSVVVMAKKRTIMWGVKPLVRRSKKSKEFSILFVGLIKESQGIEFLLSFLKSHRDYKVYIIGICNNNLYQKYQKAIKLYKIESQVFFPNKFYTDKELQNLSKKCHIGIGLYNPDVSNPTYYTDPGKIKAYAEMGLPVIMTNTSGVAPYIKRFNAGILINRSNAELGKALAEMKKNYKMYILGIKKLNEYFYYKNYYRKSFKALESI